jgi:hypothetical protein
MAAMNDADPSAARARDFCLRAVAYLQKAEPQDAELVADEAARATGDDAPVVRALGHGLLAAYVVEENAEFHYVLAGELAAAGLTRDELHAVATRNLEAIARRSAEVHPYGHIHAVLMGDDFEASLLLCDGFWDAHAELAPGGLVAAIPARNVLAFGDLASPAALRELDDLCTRVDPAIDHPLTDTLLRRVDGRWEPLGA